MTNADLIEALRAFWPNDDQEAAAFLGALLECAEGAMENSDMGPEVFGRFAAVCEAIDVEGPALVSPTPRSRLLEAAGQGGVTISSAAHLLGVTRHHARQILGGLRDEGALRVDGQGRASRWVRSGT